MDPLESVCRAIRDRVEPVRSLEKAEKVSRMLPWYRFAERVYWQGEIASLRSQVEGYDKQIGVEDVLRLANIAGAELWNKAAKAIIPNKNPYGRAAQEHFNELFELTLKEREELVLDVGRLPFRLSKLPDVDEHLTDAFIESTVRDIMSERSAVAASTSFAHERFRDDKQPVMIVQHLASGLRARFTLIEPGIGIVFSKPRDIRSIDPDMPASSVKWESHLGLGIGERIYQEAHRLAPNVRWLSGAYTPYSTRLRQKLHAADPYIWSTQCDWCEQKLIKLNIYSWRDADKEFFNDHP